MFIFSLEFFMEKKKKRIKKRLYMKKIFLIIGFLILLSSQIFSLSLFGAQDISKKYLSENEMIDTFTQPKISCENQDYFVIPIINSLGEPVLFIPISIKDSELYISKTDSFNIKLIKTEYLLKELINSDPNNYLSSQLIDRFDSLINVLNSKKAQLEGLSNKGYSFDVNDKLTITTNNLDNLISSLTILRENLNQLIINQNSFLFSPDCDDTSSLLVSFEDSFKGYNELSQISQNYLQSTDQLITAIVSDESIPSQDTSSIISIASAPQNITSQINYISERLSSTSSFYLKISNNLKGSLGDQKIKIHVDNLVLRKNYVILKDLYEKYDSSFPNYSNLEAVIQTILNPEYRFYWKEIEEVNNIQSLYNDIKEHSQKAQYSQAISKTSILKTKSLKVLEAGFNDQETETDWFYYISIGVIIIILIIFLIILRKRGFSKKKFSKKKTSKKETDVFNFEDPF